MVDPLLVIVIVAIIAIGISSIWAAIPPSERTLRRALRRTGESRTGNDVSASVTPQGAGGQPERSAPCHSSPNGEMKCLAILGAYCLSAYAAFAVIYLANGEELNLATGVWYGFAPFTYPFTVVLSLYVHFYVAEVGVEIRPLLWSLATFVICMVGALFVLPILGPTNRWRKRCTASNVLLACGILGSLALVGCSNNAIDAQKTKWEDKGWTYFETVGKPIEDAHYILHFSSPTASSVSAMATADSRPIRKEYHQEEFVYLVVTMGPDPMNTFSLVFYKPKFTGAKHHKITEGNASLVPRSLPKLAFDIDGSVADWTVGTTICDDLGVSTGNEPEWFVDVQRVMVHSDKTFLYVFVECSPSIEAMFARSEPASSNILNIYFDSDDQPGTGCQRFTSLLSDLELTGFDFLLSVTQGVNAGPRQKEPLVIYDLAPFLEPQGNFMGSRPVEEQWSVNPPGLIKHGVDGIELAVPRGHFQSRVIRLLLQESGHFPALASTFSEVRLRLTDQGATIEPSPPTSNAR